MHDMLSNRMGAIQVLRNAMGVGVSAFPKKALRRCKVQHYSSYERMGGPVGVKFPGKKRYVTL